MELSGNYFTYNGISSMEYGMIFANANTSRNLALTGEIASVTVFNKRDKRNYLIGESYEESALVFEAEVITDDDHALDSTARREVEKWLFHQADYRKLYIDTGCDTKHSIFPEFHFLNEYGDDYTWDHGEIGLFFNLRNPIVIGETYVVKVNQVEYVVTATESLFMSDYCVSLNVPGVFEIQYVKIGLTDFEEYNAVYSPYEYEENESGMGAFTPVSIGIYTKEFYESNVPYYLNCRFIRPEKLESVAGVVGYKFTVECDSAMAWRNPSVIEWSFSDNSSIAESEIADVFNTTVTVDVDTDIRDYVYPKVTVTTGDVGGDIMISNLTDDPTRVTAFVGLTPNITFTMNGNGINYISGDNYLKFSNRHFIRLLDGENTLSLYGDISGLKIEFQNQRYL